MTLSQAYRDAAYPAETSEVFVGLVTIEHADLPTPILINDSGVDIVYASDLVDGAGNVAARAGTYVAMPIEIEAPGQSDTQMQGVLRIPNLDQRIGAAIRTISTPATVTITAVLGSDPTDIVGGPHHLLRLVDVRGDAMVVEGRIRRPSLTVQPYPRHWIRASVFRAAYRLS